MSIKSASYQRAEAERRAQAARAVDAPVAPYNAEEVAMIARIGAMPESRHRGALIGLLLMRYRYRLGEVSYAHVKAAQIEVDQTAGQEVIPW